MSLTLDTYRTLGRSGLRVSPLALGTATFGTEWGWGAERAVAQQLFDRYTAAGGNLIDTGNNYTDGSSERLLGEFTRADRDRLVLGTKYSTLSRPDDPNSSGAHRKNLAASVETSLRRLNTDYLDLLYLHVWDFSTPIDEILRAMDDLVRQGKVLYLGVSTAPAWQVSRMQAIAELRGWSPLIALQIEYSLIERGGERDLLPMAHEMGLGVVPFSPLGGGVLTGKYSRADLDAANHDASETNRKSVNLTMGMVTERTIGIADVVREVASEVGRSPSQVALSWTLANPAIAAPVVGARTTAQLDDNLGALDIDLSPDHLRRLDEASAIDLGIPHSTLAGDHIRRTMAGDLKLDLAR